MPNEFCQLKILYKSKEEMVGTIVVMEVFFFWQEMGLGFSRKGPVGLKEGEKSEEHILHKRKPSFSGVVARQVWRAASQPCI